MIRETDASIPMKKIRHSSKRGTTLDEILDKQIKGLRQDIIKFKVMRKYFELIKQGQKNPNKVTEDNVAGHISIILFGPAGSGKSSLIRSFYRALH